MSAECTPKFGLLKINCWESANQHWKLVKSCKTVFYKFIRGAVLHNFLVIVIISIIILLHEKFLQFDWLRAVVFQRNLKYLHVKITTFCGYWYKQIIAWFVLDISHKYHSWYFKIVSNFTRLTARKITYNNFEISLVVFMPNTTTNHAITYTNYYYYYHSNSSAKLIWKDKQLLLLLLSLLLCFIFI